MRKRTGLALVLAAVTLAPAAHANAPTVGFLQCEYTDTAGNLVLDAGYVPDGLTGDCVRLSELKVRRVPGLVCGYRAPSSGKIKLGQTTVMPVQVRGICRRVGARTPAIACGYSNDTPNVGVEVGDRTLIAPQGATRICQRILPVRKTRCRRARTHRAA